MLRKIVVLRLQLHFYFLSAILWEACEEEEEDTETTQVYISLLLLCMLYACIHNSDLQSAHWFSNWGKIHIKVTVSICIIQWCAVLPLSAGTTHTKGQDTFICHPKHSQTLFLFSSHFPAPAPVRLLSATMCPLILDIPYTWTLSVLFLSFILL